MEIHSTFRSDDYLQIPILKHFCYNHQLRTNENKADLIHAISAYANQSKQQFKETLIWLDNVLKEGNKELYYKKIVDFDLDLLESSKIEKLINKIFPNNPHQHLVLYTNTESCELVNYSCQKDEDNEKISKISLTFSQKLLEGYEEGERGREVVYPVFIDIYLKEKFIIGRGKYKTILYGYNEEDEKKGDIIVKKNQFKTREFIMNLMNLIIDKFKIICKTDNSIIKNEIAKMHYKLYDKYTFTPEKVKKQIIQMSEFNVGYVKNFFSELNLSVLNIPDAIRDIEIFTEKYISINGDNEEIFKNRGAYLTKVASKDIQEMATIDAKTDNYKPLQCTDIFFDSKKAIMKMKECKKINLCFKRKVKKYYEEAFFEVQFMYEKGYGIIKFRKYIEESDISDVIQTVFENY